VRRRRGFTLIEVLVALVIVAFGMGAALKALTSAADSTARLREKTFAAWIGLNQLATERLGTGVQKSGSQEAEVEYAGSRWHWQQTIEDMEVPGLKRITVRVRHSDQKGKIDKNADTSSSSKSSSPQDADWLATVVGFRGDSLEYPQSELAGWDDAGNAQQAPSPTPNTPGQLPGQSPTPTPAPTPGQSPFQTDTPPTTP
jgi:general secretion pathway protein I